MWKTRARGLFTKKLVSGADLSGKDFLIAQYGDPLHTNVQTAADKGIPAMLFYPNDPEKLIIYGYGSERWGDDVNEDLQNIIDSVMVGGVNGTPRAIHGVMIDCSKVLQANGQKLTANWIVGTAKHLGNRVWDLLRLPVWFYMNMEPINAYKGDWESLEVLNTFIDQCGGIATVDWASTFDDEYPTDTEKPTLPYDGGKPWSYWFYLVWNSNIDVLSYASKDEIYGDEWLNYSPSTPVNGGDSGDSTLPEVSGTTDELLALMVEEQRKTNELLDMVIDQLNVGLRLD